MSLFKDSESDDQTIPANGAQTFRYVGTFIQNLQSDGDLEVSVDDGPICFFGTGIKKTTPFDESGQQGVFTKVRIINNTGTDIDVKVAYGFGDVSDSSFKVSGALPVENKAGESLDVNIGGVDVVENGDTHLRTHDEILLSLLNGDTNGLMLGATKLGSNVVGVKNNNGLNTLITPAANTDGIVICQATISSGGSNETALYADTAAPSNVSDNTKRRFLYSQNKDVTELAAPIIIPAGLGLYFYSNGAGNENNCNVVYDTLA